jgi:hypothetical protein
MPTSKQKVGRKFVFKAFLSHSYKEEEANTVFFDLFQEVASVQFEIDIGLKNLNVTRLERRMRGCDAFVGVYPFPEKTTAIYSSDDILMPFPRP